MLLSDYFKVRCGNGDKLYGLSVYDIEKKNFKIPDLRKGWYNRIKDIEIPDCIIVKTCKEMLDYPRIRPKIIPRIQKIIDRLGDIEETFDIEVGTTYLYIMRNELGMLKVGISKTPEKRARNLSTGSGLNTDLLSYYAGKFPAVEVENDIFSKLKTHIKLGEWFKVDTVTVKQIEDIIPKSYSRIWSCKDIGIY